MVEGVTDAKAIHIFSSFATASVYLNLLVDLLELIVTVKYNINDNLFFQVGTNVQGGADRKNASYAASNTL